MNEKEKQIDAIRTIITKEAEEAGARNYQEMATALYEAGYRLPTPLSPISDTEIRKAMAKANREAQHYDTLTHMPLPEKEVALAQLAADRKKVGIPEGTQGVTTLESIFTKGE